MKQNHRRNGSRSKMKLHKKKNTPKKQTDIIVSQYNGQYLALVLQCTAQIDLNAMKAKFKMRKKKDSRACLDNNPSA